MTTSTPTETATPVVDRLFALVAHLAKHNCSDVAEHIASIDPARSTRMTIQFQTGRRDELVALAATLTEPTWTALVYPADKYHPTGWIELAAASSIAGVPLRAWVAVDASEGDTVESVVALAQRDATAFAGSREG